jgi:hypothetical protein
MPLCDPPQATPAASRSLSLRPELYPFQSRWLESSAGRVHYVDEGEGQPILMCHGNSGLVLGNTWLRPTRCDT